ncbi:MAG: hypothetical protein F6K56_41620 [Moorea sp. SIO3G5]|nr:hypothetical protein [Moorena sp. SIO3G5]
MYLITRKKAINKKPKAKGEQPNNLGLKATLRQQPHNLGLKATLREQPSTK